MWSIEGKQLILYWKYDLIHIIKNLLFTRNNIWSVRAYTQDGSEMNELGFMTGKPFYEMTGFAEYNKSKHGSDLIAIEMVSNTGMIIYKIF